MKPSDQPSLPDLDQAPVRRARATDDLPAIFREQARQLGLTVIDSTEASAAQVVADIVAGLSGHTTLPAIMLEPSLDMHTAIRDALGDRVEFLDPHAGDDAMFAADVSVTGVEAAVAETGSLVCVSGPGLWRGLSLIPPVHIAIVRVRQIVPDLLDLLADRSPDDLPANLTLISGPSKTADIEGILITGVHGPGHVHVVLVR